MVSIEDQWKIYKLIDDHRNRFIDSLTDPRSFMPDTQIGLVYPDMDRFHDNIKKTIRIDTCFACLRSFGLDYTLYLIRKFGYWFLYHKRCYYIFVIQNKMIINVAKTDKRNKIGTALTRFQQYDIIVWYPRINLGMERFRFYKSVRDGWSGFHYHERIILKQWKGNC